MAKRWDSYTSRCPLCASEREFATRRQSLKWPSKGDSAQAFLYSQDDRAKEARRLIRDLLANP